MINNKTERDYQDCASKWWSVVKDGSRTKGSKNCTIQVTENCNLACTYCYQINKSPKSISFDTAKSYIDRILEDNSISDNYESLILDFIGGEPLLEIKLIDKLVDYFKFKAVMLDSKFAYRFRISICTNGTLYFSKDTQNFIRKNRNNLSFSISLDGNKILHDACRVFPNGNPTYDLVIKAAYHYRDNYGGELPGTKMTLSPDNISYLFDALINMINIGYTNIFSNYVYESDWTVDDARKLYYGLKLVTNYIYDNNLEETIYISLFEEDSFRPINSNDDDNNWCGGNGEMLAVDPDGIIYPCLRYMKSSLGDSQPPITCGNVLEGIDHSVLNCMKCVTRSSQSTKECLNCPVAIGCAWCTAYNYQVTGSINSRVTKICIMHKARALANAYYWNKMYIKHGYSKVFKIYLSDEDSLKIIDQNELNLLHDLTRR